MKTKDDITLAAPCGTYCGDCECFKAKDNPALMEYLVAKGLKREKLPCPGCRPLKGKCPAIGTTCKTYTCITGRGLDFCFECQDFPCAKLNPAVDRANVLPHNMKVFNLCCIKNQGLAKFIEKLPEIKQRYYKGKMAIGRGPYLDGVPTDTKWTDDLDNK